MNYQNEVKERYKQIAKQMGIEAPPLKIIGSSKRINATANFKTISMSKGLAKLVHVDSQLVEILIAHELIHYKNRDSHTKFKNLYRLFSKKFYAFNLLFELRASIGAYSHIGIKKVSDIIENEKKFKEPKYYDNNRLSYIVGYPTSKQIAYYASQYDELTVEISKEILGDFCKAFNIHNPEKFIDDIIKIARV